MQIYFPRARSFPYFFTAARGLWPRATALQEWCRFIFCLKSVLGEPPIQTGLSTISQLLDSHASPSTGSNTSTFIRAFWDTIYLYRLSYRRKSVSKTVPGGEIAL